MMTKRGYRLLALGLTLLVALHAPMAALATVVQNYGELADAALRKDAAIEILGRIDFTGEAPVEFDYNVTIASADPDVQAELVRDPGDTGRFIVVTGGAVLTASDLAFTGGAAIAGDLGGNGGAVHAAGSVILTGCEFSQNSAEHGFLGNGGDGGAVYVTGSATLTNCAFSQNSAANNFEGDGGNGGAVYVTGSLTLTDCEFSQNTADNNLIGNGGHGGAVYVAGSAALENCEFTQNSALDGHGGAVYVDGAGVTGASAALDGCEFSQNSAAGNGGGLYVRGDWMAASFIEAVLTDTAFTDNNAGNYGGGAAIYGNAMFYGDAAFTDNSADKNGGGLSVYWGHAAFHGDSTFTDNEAGVDGGGAMLASGATFHGDAAFSGNSAGEWGGGAYIIVATFHGDAAFTSNQAQQGGGAWLYGPAAFEGNAVFTENTASHSGGGLTHSTFDPATQPLVLQDCTFLENTSPSLGGAITSNGDVFLEGDSYLVDNTTLGNWGNGIEARNLTVTGEIYTSLPEPPPPPPPESGPQPPPKPILPTHLVYRNLSYSRQWCWQLFLAGGSKDFRVHQLLPEGDAMAKGDAVLFKTTLTEGPDGNVMLALKANRQADDPLMIAFTPALLEWLVGKGVTTLAMIVPRTGTTHVYDLAQLLKDLQASGQTGAVSIWLTGTGEPPLLERADGSLVPLGR